MSEPFCIDASIYHWQAGAFRQSLHPYASGLWLYCPCYYGLPRVGKQTGPFQGHVGDAVIHLLDRKKSVNYLMIELPEYKLPDSRTVAIYVWEKVKDYLEKAGTTIFIATLAIWLLLNFGPQGYSPDMAQSFGAILGK